MQIFIINKLIHYLSKKKKNWMAISIESEKAFDNSQQCFLIKAPRKFPSK